MRHTSYILSILLLGWLSPLAQPKECGTPAPAIKPVMLNNSNLLTRRYTLAARNSISFPAGTFTVAAAANANFSARTITFGGDRTEARDGIWVCPGGYILPVTNENK